LAQVRTVIKEAGIAVDNANDRMLWEAILAATGGLPAWYRLPAYAVLSIDETSPPGTPAQGDAYVVGAPATGDWAGLEDRFVVWDGDAWLDFPVPLSTLITASDTGDDWRRTASGFEPWLAAAALDLGVTAPVLMVQESRGGSSSPYFLPDQAYTSRHLNTILVNQIGASLNGSTYEISLPAGIYRARAAAVCVDAGHHHIRLYNVTGATEIASGTSQDTHPDASSDSSASSELIGRFTLSSPSTIRLDHYAELSGSRLSGEDNSIPGNHVDAYLELTLEKPL